MPKDQRDLMIEKQAQLIDRLRKDAETARDQAGKALEELRIKALRFEHSDALAREVSELRATLRVWLDLQKQIIDNPMLQNEWQNFVALLKMAADETYVERAGGNKSDA